MNAKWTKSVKNTFRMESILYTFTTLMVIKSSSLQNKI